MSQNLNKVRAKEVTKSNRNKLYLTIVLIFIGLLGVTLTLAFTTFSNKLGFAFAPLEIVKEGNRQIIKVPIGGNLQEAIDRANGGDIIELQAGGVYADIRLPNKNISDYITIQSSGAKNLPPNQIVKPSQANLMAKIVTRVKGGSALSTADKAHHFRFIGIEFTPTNSDYIYNLIYLGTESKAVADIPHHFEFDRCYVHSINAGVTRRGMALNSANVTIKNSYFEGFAYPQEETQGICGWTGTKNIVITNNYIEGGAENVMFGGSDPQSPAHVPQDIEVSKNHFNKPESWKGKNSIKCLFEVKNAKRLQFVGNYLENNWNGSAFRITVRNQEGSAPYSTIEDMIIQDNIINGAGEAINILGKDDTYPSQIMKRLTITNNLFMNIGTPKYEGQGYFLQINNGDDILVANNTVINQGNFTVFHGELPRNLLIRDNIAGHGPYGIHGHPAIKSSDGEKTVQNNIIVNTRNISLYDSAFPPKGNFWLPDFQSIGFANMGQNDYRLSSTSKYKGKGKNNSDIGSNLSPILKVFKAN